MTLGSETRELETLIEELSVLAEGPLAKARVMPRQVYLSEEFLAREEEKIFHQEWLCAGREDDIPEVGDFITYQIGRQPIIVVRLSNQSIHAMANVCRRAGLSVRFTNLFSIWRDSWCNGIIGPCW